MLLHMEDICINPNAGLPTPQALKRCCSAEQDRLLGNQLVLKTEVPKMPRAKDFVGFDDATQYYQPLLKGSAGSRPQALH